MSLRVHLTEPGAPIDAGGEGVSSVTVVNTSSVVRAYRLDLVGVTGWAFVEPRELRLFPEQAGDALVHFRPPKTPDVTAGAHPFAVKVTATDEEGLSTVEEGTVNVAPWCAADLSVHPKTARGNRKAKYRLVLVNTGNTRQRFDLSAADEDELLELKLQHDELALDAGETGTVPLRVRTYGRVSRGERLPFTATVQGPGLTPTSSTGALAITPALGPWLVRAAIAFLALALVVGGFMLTRNTDPKSTAGDAAVKQTSTSLQPGVTLAPGEAPTDAVTTAAPAATPAPGSDAPAPAAPGPAAPGSDAPAPSDGTGSAVTPPVVAPPPSDSAAPVTPAPVVTPPPTTAGPRPSIVTIAPIIGTPILINPVVVAPASGWKDYVRLGGVMTSGPATASWASGRLDVFARSSTNSLMHWYYNGAWNGPEDLGGGLTADPAAVSWGNGRIDVFVRGGDNALYQKWYDSTGWHGFVRLGGVMTSGPSVASWGAGRLDIFARGQSNGLIHWYYNGAWNGPEELGGILTADPAAVSWGSGRIDIFVRGTDNTLFQKTYDAAGWHDYVRVTAAVTSGPAVASWAAGRLDLFARGSNNALWHWWYDGAWHGSEDLGGILSADPAAESWGSGRIDVFVRGTDNALFQKTYG